MEIPQPLWVPVLLLYASCYTRHNDGQHARVSALEHDHAHPNAESVGRHTGCLRFKKERIIAESCDQVFKHACSIRYKMY